MSAQTTPQQALNKVGSAVAIIMSIMLGLVIGMLSQLNVPTDNHDIMIVLVTALATNVTQIVSFFFGSTVGTSRQGDIIATQAATASKLADTAAAAAGTTTVTTSSTTKDTP